MSSTAASRPKPGPTTTESSAGDNDDKSEPSSSNGSLPTGSAESAIYVVLERRFRSCFGRERLLDQLDAELSLFEQALTPVTQARAQFEAVERLIERKLTAIEQGNNGLERGH